MNNLYKLGYSRDLSKRLSNHSSSHADDIEVLHVYETDDIEAVEACVKGLMQDKQYRKRKEIYQADIDMIKDFIDFCSTEKMKYRAKKLSNSQTGGYYTAIYKNT
jgi:hypothetical protein